MVANRDGDPLSYTQFKRLWQYIVTRTTKERVYYRYKNGKRVNHTVTPVLGEKAAHNGKVVYSLEFEVTPHQLRHTYIANLIHVSVDPKTVQYLPGHESGRATMDIYAQVKYNKPEKLVGVVNAAFHQRMGASEAHFDDEKAGRRFHVRPRKARNTKENGCKSRPAMASLPGAIGMSVESPWECTPFSRKDPAVCPAGNANN